MKEQVKRSPRAKMVYIEELGAMVQEDLLADLDYVPVEKEHQKNEPLALDELRQMQGQPVWVRDQGGKGIPVCGIVHNNCIVFASGSVVWLDENAGDVKCGSWWFAYRHKPQEG